MIMKEMYTSYCERGKMVLGGGRRKNEGEEQ